MDLMYIRNRDGQYDSGILSNFKIDVDISTDTEYVTNDFELQMNIPDDAEELYYVENEVSTIIYAEGTEFGGEITGYKIDVGEGLIKYTGRTWRGLLEEWIIEPPAGQDYKVVSGNLAASIRTLPLPSVIEVQDTTYSGNRFQFDRYCTTFAGITKLIQAANPDLRIAIDFEQDAGAYTGKARLSIVPVRDMTNMVEVSQDYNDKIQLQMTRDGKTPRHLICLGKGELHEREVIHLYADSNWNITRTAIAGAHPVETYDFSASEALLADGTKHYQELISNHKQIDVQISGLDVRLGDIISARHHLIEEDIQAEITKIIWHCENFGNYQVESYEYKTKVRI